MAFNDLFRVGSHAVFLNEEQKVLLLLATYGDRRWGLPGGALDPGETVHQALERECMEELGIKPKVLYMSGIYYHKAHNSQSCIFRCELPKDAIIHLSSEHSEYRYFGLDELNEVQRHRVLDCFNFDGKVKSCIF